MAESLRDELVAELNTHKCYSGVLHTRSEPCRHCDQFYGGLVDRIMPLIEAALVEAWDEGHDVGYDSGQRAEWDTQAMPAPNPYRGGGE